MADFVKIDTIEKVNNLFGGQETLHPLISIVDFSKIDSQKLEIKIQSSLYVVLLKEQCSDGIKYGRETIDFQSGSLIFISPNQIVSINEEVEPSHERNWGLFFHPDLLKGTSLNAKMKDYNFFMYSNNEALHLSKKEKAILNEIIEKIELELSLNIDKHSKPLIITNIELLLNYCSRFFDRQFITRSTKNQDVLSKVETTLNDYFHSDVALLNGLPTVKYLADKLHFSPNYLSDLLKKETGFSTLDHIHRMIVEEAKIRLLLPNRSISSVAYDLGFEYPQYFTRIFKKSMGMTPKEYIKMN